MIMKNSISQKVVFLSFCVALLVNMNTAFAAPADVVDVEKALQSEKTTAFPVGTYNVLNVTHFTGDSYVAPLSTTGPLVAAVTFYDGARRTGISIMGPVRFFWRLLERDIIKSGVKSPINFSLDNV